MPRALSQRTYGRSTRTRPALMELPQSPIRRPPSSPTDQFTIDEDDDSIIRQLEKQLDLIEIGDESGTTTGSSAPAQHVEDEKVDEKEDPEIVILADDVDEIALHNAHLAPTPVTKRTSIIESVKKLAITHPTSTQEPSSETALRILTWHDVCPPGDTITKIAEASYAEVYRVRNARGTSIIKCIRLPSPLKAQTKAQVRSGLVDEEPHAQTDLQGELRISEWLADIPGFVIYKERYIVEGRAPKTLLEAHQAFQKKMRRQDPDRLQFYPSPSRYLDGTRFLVVELGDAGVALEDFEVTTGEQLWDIFFLVAVALARAEDLIAFEHRDLHEGNLCIRQVTRPRMRNPSRPGPSFGYSGLDITILDYGLSRAEEPLTDEDDSLLSTTDPEIVALDLEKDLSIFTSTHADQCKVYRQMRSFLLSGGTSRKCLPPSSHRTPYQPVKLPKGTSPTPSPGPVSWSVSAPYTNVLWLAYIYQYALTHFSGPAEDAARWRRDTAELWRHLDPDAKLGTPVFACAADVVRFALEAGWVSEEQVMGEGGDIDGARSFLGVEREHEDSIILSVDVVEDEPPKPEPSPAAQRVRRSGRTKATA
ncbi:hypothetical protein F5X68DRAFT_258573 [Plectosphaerella plurivora]|uniref:non-specific serine/threonine protein kinase n=1 Tax=Plectosphaerella plurivora TaxID=936078 RepID=A0A9P8VHQ9_9PEZI|nr:hypothetical protein F5X68DRAFT_258573 [Plectosphaerella plurivora]